VVDFVAFWAGDHVGFGVEVVGEFEGRTGHGKLLRINNSVNATFWGSIDDGKTIVRGPSSLMTPFYRLTPDLLSPILAVAPKP
jgi:hypothetical protein